MPDQAAATSQIGELASCLFICPSVSLSVGWWGRVGGGGLEDLQEWGNRLDCLHQNALGCAWTVMLTETSMDLGRARTSLCLLCFQELLCL